MRILLQTQIKNRNCNSVFKKFDKELFLKLAPPFPRFELVQFDGCNTNDLVEIRLRFFFSWLTWKSRITSSFQTEKECCFVDKGIVLPFFLSYWEHTHRIVQQEKDVVIIDDIQFKAHNWVLTFLSYPVMYVMFAGRKAIYQKEL